MKGIKNIQSLFQNKRTRLIFLSTLAIILFLFLFGFNRFVKSTSSQHIKTSYLPNVNLKQSTYVANNDYQKLQEEKNKTTFQEAEKKGNSILPTVFPYMNTLSPSTTTTTKAHDVQVNIKNIWNQSSFSLQKEALAFDHNGQILGQLNALGKIIDLKKQVVGSVRFDGLVINSSKRVIGLIGNVLSKALVFYQDRFIGIISSDGHVYRQQKWIGRALINGVVCNDVGNVIGNISSIQSQLLVFDQDKPIGIVRDDGWAYDLQNKRIGIVLPSGEIKDDKKNIIGKVSPWKAGEWILNDHKQKVGEISIDGKIYAQQNCIGILHEDGMATSLNYQLQGKLSSFSPHALVFNQDVYVGYTQYDGQVVNPAGRLLGYLTPTGDVKDEKAQTIGAITPWVAHELIYDQNKIFGSVDIYGNIYNHSDKVGSVLSHDAKNIQGERIKIWSKPKHFFAFDNNDHVLGVAFYNDKVNDLSGKLMGLSYHHQLLPLKDYIGYAETFFVSGSPVYNDQNNLFGIFDYSTHMIKDVNTGEAVAYIDRYGRASYFKGGEYGHFYHGFRGSMVFDDQGPIGALDYHNQLRNEAGHIIGKLTANDLVQSIDGGVLGSVVFKEKTEKTMTEQSRQQLRNNTVITARSMMDEWHKTSNQQLVQGSILPESQKEPKPSPLEEKAVLHFKEGDILYASLLTAVNTDSPGPVLARITSGSLQGATLLGSMTGQTEKVYIQFNSINLPYYPKTLAIQAVAIDVYTLNTSLVSKVDKHFLERYFSLAVSSFASGYAKAISMSNAEYIQPNGQPAIIHHLTNKDKVYTAIGEVGSKIGSDIGAHVNRPHTVYVYAGTPIGLLFTSNVSIPRGL